uniref:Knottins-like domain-containing protein n=2 Tax=Oryza brachyantha TaxID=4533 RepID=J3LAV1_ORYBR
MEPSRKLSMTAAVLLLLIVATEMGTVVQAKLCQKESSEFRGVCIRSQNCANKCKLEGYVDGKCRYLTRRCFCTVECGSDHGGLTP